jgi:DNA (cytosine-5)-methyltransferase 1
MKDGPRYKIIGNGWALPCVQWIGRRIINQINETP